VSRGRTRALWRKGQSRAAAPSLAPHTLPAARPPAPGCCLAHSTGRKPLQAAAVNRHGFPGVTHAAWGILSPQPGCPVIAAGRGPQHPAPPAPLQGGWDWASPEIPPAPASLVCSEISSVCREHGSSGKHISLPTACSLRLAPAQGAEQICSVMYWFVL